VDEASDTPCHLAERPVLTDEYPLAASSAAALGGVVAGGGGSAGCAPVTRLRDQE